MRAGGVSAAERENAAARSAKTSGAEGREERIAAARIVRRMAAHPSGGGTGLGKLRTEYTLWRTRGHARGACREPRVRGSRGLEASGRQARKGWNFPGARCVVWNKGVSDIRQSGGRAESCTATDVGHLSTPGANTALRAGSS